jgi:4'-phosphopantetheinyl transferase
MGQDLAGSLSPDEQERASRFRFPVDRQRFVLGRGLLRHLTGRYLGLEPAALLFEYTPYGKPFLRRPIEFNIAHSGEQIVVAFSAEHRVGVDIERTDPTIDVLEIATGFFSAREVAAIQSVRGDQRLRAFFRCWALKEAFLKALGDGLSRPLGDFDVAIGQNESPAVTRVSWDPPAPSHWHLTSIDIDPAYMAAVCVEASDCQVVLRSAAEAY